MAQIPPEKKLAIQNALDIVEVIGEVVPLTQRRGEFWACCPFHEEKRASFHVRPDGQYFKCFGCGEGGDVITFMMKYHRLGFVEAMEELAQRAGISLEVQPGRDEGPRRETLLELHDAAEAFYHQLLVRGPEAAAARDYLAGRGIHTEEAAEWRLGWAPPGRDRFVRHALGRGYSRADLVASGLARERDGSLVDGFYSRVLFPIRDVRGQVVAFGGRTLDGSEPKYLNSPETRLFSKQRHLYGLDRAAREAAGAGRLGVVEGYTDVIAAHRHGYRWVVATLGTALTESHVRLIRRYVQGVVFIFDGDKAGGAASRRGLDIALAGDLDVRVVELPSGQDPFDCLGGAPPASGPAVFERCVGAASDFVAWMVHRAGEGKGLDSPALVAATADEVLRVLVSVGNPVKRSLYRRQAAEALRIPERDLVERFRTLATPRPRGRAPAGSGLPGEAGRAALGDAGVDRAAVGGIRDALEGELLEALVHRPGLAGGVRTLLGPERFRDPRLRGAVEALYAATEHYAPAGPAQLLAVVDETTRSALEACLARGEEGKDYSEATVKALAERFDVRDATEAAGRLRDGLPGLEAAAQDEALRQLTEAHRRRAGGRRLP